MPANFATGFRQKPDGRDHQFPLSALMGASVTQPVSKVWQAAKVTDQGTESSCVGHSTWKLIGSEPIVRAATVTPSHIYVEAKRIDEWNGEDYDGTSVRAGLEVLRRLGYVKNYYWAESAEECLEYLLKFGPLVLGIRWTDSMMRPDSMGMVRPIGSGGSGHAVLAYAAHWKQKTIKIRNSWGETWGKKGDCIMRLADLNRLLKEGGVAAAATE
jgi:hypothetical protein